MKDFNMKINRIRQLLKQKNGDALILTSQPSFSWLTGGRGHVNLASEGASGQIVVTPSSIFLITNNIECARLKTEEGCNVFDQVLSYYWFESGGEGNVLHSLIGTGSQRIVYESECDKELSLLRSLLTPSDIEQYRQLGHDAALALEKTCKNLKRGQTEWEVAAQLAFNCMKSGIEPVVNLVAADERVSAYRHPLPTGKSIDKYILIALGARRHGLTASLTRLVHFGKITGELKRKQEAVAAVDAAFISHTVPGTELSAIFQAGQQEYKDQGFASEWKNHHQGGLTGYRSREIKVTEESEGIVKENQAYAWNPSITGVKSEDTVIVGESGHEIITRTGDFPEMVLEVNGHQIPRPTILERMPVTK